MQQIPQQMPSRYSYGGGGYAGVLGQMSRGGTMAPQPALPETKAPAVSGGEMMPSLGKWGPWIVGALVLALVGVAVAWYMSSSSNSNSSQPNRVLDIERQASMEPMEGPPPGPYQVEVARGPPTQRGPPPAPQQFDPHATPDASGMGVSPRMMQFDSRTQEPPNSWQVLGENPNHMEPGVGQAYDEDMAKRQQALNDRAMLHHQVQQRGPPPPQNHDQHVQADDDPNASTI